MKGKHWTIASLVGLGLVSMSNVATATPVVCQDITKNYMEVDSSKVTECIDAGVGNINGNPANDDFLTGGGTALGYTGAGTGTFDAGAKTWSFSSALWGSGPLAIGFKFGTGNTPDEWFIYRLVTNVTSGSFTFYCTLCKGEGAGGISHVQLYNAPGDSDSDTDSDVPEPGTLALLGLGLMGLGVARRRKF